MLNEKSQSNNDNMNSLTEWYNYFLKLNQETFENQRKNLLNQMNLQILNVKRKRLLEKSTLISDILSQNTLNTQVFYNFKSKRRFTSPLQKSGKTQTYPPQVREEYNFYTDFVLDKSKNDSFVTNLSPGRKILITSLKQKWVVDVTKFSDNSFNIKFCDGSSSRITTEEAQALNIRFEDM